MKLAEYLWVCVSEVVAPLVGAWIEIAFRLTAVYMSLVAPLVGAWIEIVGYSVVLYVAGKSLLL